MLGNKLTVVVPVYAEAVLVEKMLASIKTQLIKPDNLVLVDDRHSKNTSDVLRNFVNHYSSPVRLIVNERNLGISLSTQVGVNEVKTKYVGFLDSDDLLKKDAISRFKKINRKFTVYSSNYSTFFTDEQLHRAVENPRMRALQMMNLASSEWQKAILFENLISHFRVVKTSFAMSFSWDKRIDGIQDLLLNYSLKISDKVHLDDLQTYFHRLHKKQTTHAISNSSKSLFLLNQGRIGWRQKLGFKNNVGNLDKKLITSVSRDFRNSSKSFFFTVSKTGKKHFINFDEHTTELDSQSLIGCFLGEEFDEYYLRRGLLYLYQRTSLPLGVFLDTRIEKQFDYIKFYSGLFDYVVQVNGDGNAQLQPFIPDEIQILNTFG